MASPCEVLVSGASRDIARGALRTAAREAHRIESAFSRYRAGNLIHAINTADGAPVAVDAELARLLDFADQLHRMSDGRFDVTSGVLRRAWHFDGGEAVPDPDAVEALLPLVGWHRARWVPPTLQLPAGMEIDLGGIGKEYAVDRAVGLITDAIDAPCLVSFGGDLRATGPRVDGRPWMVGVERPDQAGVADRGLGVRSGALATSGDAHRFVIRDGVRHGHILDPRTGWPVEGAPRSVTVAADTCTEAGMLATLSMLEGDGAEAFLDRHDVRSWVVR